jgi:hypothetical protein
MLDRDGFRPNVGIILLNQKNQVFWGKRIRTHSWQFPQGGIDRGEKSRAGHVPRTARRSGLQPEHVRIVARTRDWLRYEVPDRYIRRDARGHYKGQKQIWYLLQLMGHDWDLEPARHRPPRVRRLALERLLGAAGCGGGVQARRLRNGADRAGALSAPRTTTATATCAAACASAPRQHQPRSLSRWTISGSATYPSNFSNSAEGLRQIRRASNATRIVGQPRAISTPSQAPATRTRNHVAAEKLAFHARSCRSRQQALAFVAQQQAHLHRALASSPAPRSPPRSCR